MHLIEVKNLTKKYGSQTVVDNLSFTVTRGECLGLLGPNGAGKTTTVEILEGFRKSTSGHVRVLGEDPMNAGPTWRDRVGVVLQSTFEASTLTVGEELKLARSSYANPLPVADVLEMVGLTEKGRSRVARLSGGQRRRLDVALGIIGRPELLFLDEPTTGFDPSARLGFQDMIARLHDAGTTILLTTHYLKEAAALADRVIVINGGRVVAEGVPESLGGPSAHLPRVTWTDPVLGTQCERISINPTAVIQDLAQTMPEIPNLQVVRPTLEEVYLGLISKGEAA